MSDGIWICTEKGKEFAKRHWERKRCKFCREQPERECPVCAGVI